MAAPRRSAAYIIAFHFGWDVRDMSEQRYQSTRYASPAIYTVGADYYCAPANNQPPKYDFGGPWIELAEHYCRKIFYVEVAKA